MRVLSGIQPTGQIHIGNYLGAVKQWIKLQEKEECIFFIADLHALTIPYNPEDLQKNIIETTAAHFASGIDPQKSIFFVQSQVKEHSELCWYLSSVCPAGDLQRMTQYKEKAKQFRKNINSGLLTYPVLQSADILLYKARAVPVGKDQVQHIELTRAIARKFNNKFGKTFPLPEALLPKQGSKIMSLANPRQKMSKSLGRENYISIFEKPEEIKKKIQSAVTDPGKQIKYNPQKKPGISNLLVIYSLFSEKTIKETEKLFQNKKYVDFKKSLIGLLTESLKPIRKKREEFLSRQVYLEETLKLGAKRAQNIAEITIREVRKKMGLN